MSQTIRVYVSHDSLSDTWQTVIDVVGPSVSPRTLAGARTLWASSHLPDEQAARAIFDGLYADEDQWWDRTGLRASFDDELDFHEEVVEAWRDHGSLHIDVVWDSLEQRA